MVLPGEAGKTPTRIPPFIGTEADLTLVRENFRLLLISKGLEAGQIDFVLMAFDEGAQSSEAGEGNSNIF